MLDTKTSKKIRREYDSLYLWVSSGNLAILTVHAGPCHHHASKRQCLQAIQKPTHAVHDVFGTPFRDLPAGFGEPMPENRTFKEETQHRARGNAPEASVRRHQPSQQVR